MKTLICYKTRGGATARYAEMLSKELEADVKQFSEVKKECFEDYDTIIVSSGTYAGLMPLTRFLKKYWKNLEPKKVVVVAVGAAPTDDPWSDFSYKRIPQKIREKIQYYKIMGEDPEAARPKDYVSKVKKENLKPILAYLQK